MEKRVATKKMRFAGAEIGFLPEEVLSAIISLTTPRDACRLAAVSAAFRSAADSDDVWSRFLPCDLPPLDAGELSPRPESKKELFFRLCDRSVLLADRRLSFALERETGAKCYMLSARALSIAWIRRQVCWRWIPLVDCRFSEGAQLLNFRWLEIQGKIESKMLSPNTTYAAYFVFKITDAFSGLQFPLQETSITIGENILKHRICLQPAIRKGGNSKRPIHTIPYWRQITTMPGVSPYPRRIRPIPEEFAACGVLCPDARNDGWMEIEMGEFQIESGENSEVCLALTQREGGGWKKGLIVQGIEIRLKK